MEEISKLQPQSMKIKVYHKKEQLPTKVHNCFKQSLSFKIAIFSKVLKVLLHYHLKKMYISTVSTFFILW